ncbi:MAG TPA: phage holin family protein [Burkholderiaceae bacterium]|nr:phage holin family protein [Burkholderiaceae bacterium]
MADAPLPEAEEKLSLPQQVAALLADLPGLVSDRVLLLSLELKRASRALAEIVALALLASILAATAWLAMWVGIAAALIKFGMSWPWACVVVMVVNLLAVAWAVLRLKSLAPLLALPATLRRFTDADAREREDGARLARRADAENLAREQETLEARRRHSAQEEFGRAAAAADGAARVDERGHGR